MKKSLIALAIAATTSTVALAQSNVAIYGVVDMGMARATADRTDGINTKTGLGSLYAPSRLGFRGTEALDSDLSAGFTVEYGITPNTNTGITTAREQSLGLTSKSLGAVKLGYMATLGKAELDKFDALRGSNFAPLTALKGTTINTSSRAGNTVAYVSPVVAGGFTFGATHSTDTTLANTSYGNGTKQERVIGLMADYTAGPFSVGYVYHKVNDVTRIAGRDNVEHMVGAKYAIAPTVTLAGSYQTDVANDRSTNKDIASVGAQFAVSNKIGVDVGFARLDDKTAANADADSWGIQANYDFSKRTSAYAGYTRVSNKNGATNVAMGATNGVTPLGTGSMTSSGFGAGLKHSF